MTDIQNKYMKFLEDPSIMEMAIRMLVSNPLERTFSIGGELVNVNLINGAPSERDVYMKIAYIWSTYSRATKQAYC